MLALMRELPDALVEDVIWGTRLLIEVGRQHLRREPAVDASP